MGVSPQQAGMLGLYVCKVAVALSTNMFCVLFFQYKGANEHMTRDVINVHMWAHWNPPI